MQEVVLNLLPNGVSPVCYISQYDGTSRVIRFHLLNGTEPLTLNGSETITLNFRKPDREEVTLSIENTSSNYIDLVISSELSDKHGEGFGEFRIQGLGTLSFKMYIESDAYGDSLKTRSISGPIATFETDLAEDLIKLDVDLEPIQDLHGYDNPWPAGGGVNKLSTNRTLGTLSGNLPSTPRAFEYNKFYVGLAGNNYYAPNNITEYSIDEHTVSLKTRFNAYGIAFPIKVEENTSYAVNASSYNSTTAKLSIGYFDADGMLISYKQNIGALNVITTPANCVTAVVIVYDGSASDTVVSVTDIFFNNPSTVTTFTPYSNICPITGYTEANIGHTGKNWIKNIVAQGWSANHVLLGQSNPNTHETHLKGGTYTISYKTRGSSLPSIYLKKQGVTDNVKLNNYDDKATFTVEDGDYRFWLYRSDGVNYEDIYESQIELGSEVTDYEPYTGTEVTVQFGQTIYKGVLDAKNSKITLTSKGMKIQDRTWIYFSQYSYFQNTVSDIKQNASATAVLEGLMCEAYANRTPQQTGSGNKNGSISGFNDTIRIKDLAYDNPTDFVNAMGNYLIVYPLAEPIEIPLSAISPIPALVGTNNVYSDASDVNVEYYTTLEGGND